MEELDPTRDKLEKALSELITIRATIHNLHEDARKNSNEWRKYYDLYSRISYIADDIKCEGLWLSEWLEYLGRS